MANLKYKLNKAVSHTFLIFTGFNGNSCIQEILKK